MKNQLLIFVLALLTITACKEAETNKENTVTEEVEREVTDHTDTFNQRMEILFADRVLCRECCDRTLTFDAAYVLHLVTHAKPIDLTPPSSYFPSYLHHLLFSTQMSMMTGGFLGR